MKNIVFFVVLGITVVIFLVNQYNVTRREGFQGSGAKPAAGSPPAGSQPELKIPVQKPAPLPLEQDQPLPYAPPTMALLAAPPGQTASVNSYPYEDPALRKAKAGRIQSVLISLRNFLAREAPGVSSLGDPTIVLPLGTARSDIRRLEDEVNVLSRNPGLESSLTVDDLDKIQANMDYLQKKWRLSANALDGVEGFQSGSGTTKSVTLIAVKELLTRTEAEKARLDAAGSTDPLITARSAKLSETIITLQGIIRDVETGRMKESAIPITQAQYDAFLPAISDPASPLPDLLAKSGSSSGLANLFGLTKDASGNVDVDASGNAALLNTYLGDFLKNTSWNLSVDYTGEGKRELIADAIKASKNIGFPNLPLNIFPASDLTGVSGLPARGEFEEIVQNLGNGSGVGAGSAMPSAAPGTAAAATTTDAPHLESAQPYGQPARLDWKLRSQQICEQIQKRGMNPAEYGCLTDLESVSEKFSFRGYARMICQRLATNYDPGIPALCGCPPPTWKGWRT